MVTLALPDRDPVTEGEVAMIHIVVSELRNSSQWRPSARGISVNLDYRWRRRGSGLVSSSRLGVVPLVFMVDHGTGGHRDYRVWLTDFAADHGPLTLTVLPGEGYRVGSAATVCVSIADRTTMSATTCPDGEDIFVTRPELRSAGEPALIEVRDARATEGQDETIDFAVTLSPAARGTVSVDWSTADRTATAGEDYVAASGTLTFAAAETARTMRKAIASNNVLLPLALGPTRMWKRPSSTSTYRKHR